jgi:hypothetical protein
MEADGRLTTMANEKEVEKPAVKTAADVLKELKAVENKTIHGATVLTPKQMLLDVSDIEKAHPDKRVKWLNLRNTEKMESRKLEGYTRLGTEEGGKALGNEMATFVIPKELYEARVAANKRKTQERLDSHRDELSTTVEAVLRELRDRHGIKLDERKLMINEG